MHALFAATVQSFFEGFAAALPGGTCRLRPTPRLTSGAVVGGAIGTATGTVAGTANAVTAPGPCAYGYHWFNGYCYPNR